MKFTFAHNNLNVKNINESIAFYQKALGLTETRRISPKSGDFVIVFMGIARHHTYWS